VCRFTFVAAWFVGRSNSRRPFDPGKVASAGEAKAPPARIGTMAIE
jgi:hypothetical protein